MLNKSNSSTITVITTLTYDHLLPVTSSTVLSVDVVLVVRVEDYGDDFRDLASTGVE